MSRPGFTLIELMMVISIAVVLTTMAASGVIGAMRKASAYNAAGAIEQVANQARLMAATRMPSGNRCFGIIISWEATVDRYFAAVIAGHPGDGQADDRAREWAQSGEQVTRKLLPAGYVVLVDGSPLKDKAEPWLSWYYRPGSGTPVGMGVAAWELGSLSVGLTPDAQASPSNMWGIPGYAPALHALAPAGLVLQAASGSPKASIKVLPSGSVVVSND
jgi:prepilin-type N-terminal cleavage/methylation domain-containing protein